MVWKKGESGNPAGLWRKGSSGNPKGRTPSTRALAECIRENVAPMDLAAIAIELAKDSNAKPVDRIAALKFLADNGWSKPKIEVETAPGVRLNLDDMDNDQLDALAALLTARASSDGDAQ